MFPLLTICSALTSPDVIGQPVELDVIRVEDAYRYQGLTVRTTFTVSQPPEYTEDLVIVGTGFDEVERTVFLPKSSKLDRGDTISVIGKLEVIAHPPAVVNGVRVEGCYEVRLSPAARLP